MLVVSLEKKNDGPLHKKVVSSLTSQNKQINKFRRVHPDAKPAFGVSILCLLGKQLVSLDTHIGYANLLSVWGF